MASALSPELLALLAPLADYRTWATSGPGVTFMDGYGYRPRMQGYQQGGESQDWSPGQLAGWDRLQGNSMADLTETNRNWDAFDPSGAYTHTWTGQGQNADMRDMLVGLSLVGGLAAAGYGAGAGGALGGGGEAGALAGGAGAEAAGTGAALQQGAVAPLSMADITAALAPTTSGLSSGGAALDAGLLSLGGSAAPYSNEGRNYPNPQSTQGSGGSPINASSVANAAGNIPWRNLVGAALGAATARDSENTTNREPWAPAQPLLRSLLGQGEALSRQYAEQPFSPQQQTAYNNLGSLLNTINTQAPGLMGGFQATASGANNYDRANPRRQLVGSSFDLSKFAPGLLNFFKQG